MGHVKERVRYFLAQRVQFGAQVRAQHAQGMDMFLDPGAILLFRMSMSGQIENAISKIDERLLDFGLSELRCVLCPGLLRNEPIDPSPCLDPHPLSESSP